VIRVKDIAILHPSGRGRRLMVMLRFYCDESFRHKKSNTFVVGGLISDERTWGRIETRWDSKNKRVGVPRFHAAHLNARKHEYEGWTPQRSKRYVKGLLKILQDQKRRLNIISVGILNKEYERIISSEGRLKFGNPYIVCFKQCISLIAEEMERHWEPDDKFSVILEQNDFQNEAIDVFYKMKGSIEWPPYRRLAACAPGGKDEYIALQPADLVAYETFRLLDEKHYGSQKIRKALNALFPHNGVAGVYFEEDTLTRLKEPLESAKCVPNGFIVGHIPSYTKAAAKS
jgi:hypothetical protein